MEHVTSIEWERRLSARWASIDDHTESEFLNQMEQLLAELPADSAVAVFERAGSLDSTGHSDLAVPLYRQAIKLGLGGERRRCAVIQMASSLRNIGQASESVTLLTAEQGVQSMIWTTRSLPSWHLLSSTQGVNGRRSRSR